MLPSAANTGCGSDLQDGKPEQQKQKHKQLVGWLAHGIFVGTGKTHCAMRKSGQAQALVLVQAIKVSVKGVPTSRCIEVEALRRPCVENVAKRGCA